MWFIDASATGYVSGVTLIPKCLSGRKWLLYTVAFGGLDIGYDISFCLSFLRQAFGLVYCKIYSNICLLVQSPSKAYEKHGTLLYCETVNTCCNLHSGLNLKTH